MLNKFEINGLDELQLFARDLMLHLQNSSSPNITILYKGGLGVGKTTFTRLLAQSLGIQSLITSPTFVGLIQHGIHGLNFFHFDLYKAPINLEEISDILSTLDSKNILVFEWAEKLPEDILKLLRNNSEVIDIEFEILSEGSRMISTNLPSCKP